MSTPYQMEQFEAKLKRALDRVKVVLDVTRAPCWAADVHHKYEDKYMLAESMTNAAAASQINSLTALGMSREQLLQLCEWSKSKSVSLRFRSEERCKFLREESRDVESPTKHVQEVSVAGAVQAALTSKVVTTVTEFFWKYEVTYELMALSGVGQDADSQLSILKRTGTVELKTTARSPPYPEAKVPAADFDVNVSWLLKLINVDSIGPQFGIDRDHAKCHTPMRNPEVQAAEEHYKVFRNWGARVAAYLDTLLRVQPDPTHKLDLKAVNVEALFAPVLPLLEDEAALSAATAEEAVASLATAASAAATRQTDILACLSSSGESVGSVMCGGDMNLLLSEEARALQEKRQSLMDSFPAGDAVATSAEATLAVILKHCVSVCTQWSEAVTYIEGMLRKQLIAAIGKEVTPADFAEYMQFHNRKLFADAYAPVPFCFAVRRSDQHSPEGTVSIEQETVGPGGDSNIAAPIVTLVAHSDRQHSMQFPLSASTNVSFGGDKYLHAWLSHQFSGETGASLTLVSRARQFSSMLVLVGRISSATTFDPKYAAIVQNKDELKIPLDLSTIPTPKEFKDAIASLSPQQQDFAKAFRSMQLESTLFGVLVIQIKPQLERVLNLPDDSLTKEIKLTQELMQLFIKYQIPSDLLAFDRNMDGMEMVDPGAAEKLDAVKEHVKAMNEMIDQSKLEEIEQRKMEEQYRAPEQMFFGGGGGGGGKGGKGGSRGGGGPPPPPGGMMPQMMAAAASFGAAPKMKKKSAAPPPPGPPMCAAPPSAPASQASPAAQSAQPAQVSQPQPQQSQSASQQAWETGTASGRDYTQVPKEMDERFERLDTDNQLRPTIISPEGSWTKRAQKALLASPTTSTLSADDQKKEKDAAFDLLDALTKSGVIPIDHASLHIVVAATHCFDKTVTETVVQDNVNPIDKVERSTLIMATTVHQKPAAALIRDAQLPRVSASSPLLFIKDE